MMLKEVVAKHSTGSMPFPILITKFLTQDKVSFKVELKGGRGVTVGLGTILRMGLVSKVGESSTGSTFRPTPHQVSSTKAKSTMIGLLFGIFGMIDKVLKNKK